MRRVDLQLPDKSDWVKIFDPGNSTIFVAVDDPSEVGDLVRVDLLIGGAGAGPRVILRGKVIAKRAKVEGSKPRGMSVALGGGEREKLSYISGYVRGGLLNLREIRRLPLRFPVTYGGIGGPCETHTRDLNEEGLFLVTEDPLPEGSEVHILLTLPGQAAPVSINGLVTHTVLVDDEDIPGMGLCIQYESDAQRAEFAKLVDGIEQLFIDNQLPDVHLL